MQKIVGVSLFFVVVLIAAIWLTGPKPIPAPAYPAPAYPAPTLLPGARVLGLGNTVLWHAPDTFVRFDGQQASLMNSRTGTETPLTAFSQRYMSTFATSNPMQISPDGKWLLWEGVDENTQTSAWCAATLDGKQNRFWPNQGRRFSKMVWMRDSRHWIGISSLTDYDKEAVIEQFDVATPSVITSTLTFPGDVSLSGLWTTPANHIVIASLVGGAGTNDFYEFPLAPASAPP